MFFTRCFSCFQESGSIQAAGGHLNCKLHRIVSVDKGSKAELAGIIPGDMLAGLNGQPVKDVFDYKTGTADERICLDIVHFGGSRDVYTIIKDEYEDPGLVFESYLMDSEKVCRNKCIFCFVDQLPADARKSLRFKDDDLRLSFLTGNFVTLTNVSDTELDRLLSYKLSPLNISVHATDPDLRVRMLGNPKAGRIIDQLKRIASAGVSMNTQIVLCPGINDGAALERTLDDLSGLAENMLSIAVVPVGLTKHRGTKELRYIKPFGRANARKVIEIITNRQQMYMSAYGRRMVFAADELYVKAGIKVPAAREYEDFYQIENGVGMMALFADEMHKGIRARSARRRSSAGIDNTNGQHRTEVVLVTGTDAAPFLEGFTAELSGLYNISFRVMPVRNGYFGETVTVAGLVTASDILRELAVRDEAAVDRKEQTERILAVPDVMLRDSGDRFLDDVTADGFVARADREVIYVPAGASGFLKALDKRFK